MNQEEAVNELGSITELIHKFNESGHIFELELHVNKRQSSEKYNNSYLSLGRIMLLVCDKYGISPTDILKNTRDRNIVMARQICHYMGLERSRKSQAEVGFYFGGKNHATALYSKSAIQNLLDTNKEFRDEWYEFLKNAS